MGSDAVAAFTEILRMLEELSQSISEYTKTTPQLLMIFLSPEGIITKTRNRLFNSAESFYNRFNKK